MRASPIMSVSTLMPEALLGAHFVPFKKNGKGTLQRGRSDVGNLE